MLWAVTNSRSSSTSATERWRPPVQPMATVRYGLALLLVAGQQVAEEVAKPRHELLALGLLDHELPHPGRPPVLRLQGVDEEGIRQEPAVEDEVRLVGNAELVAERQEVHAQPRLRRLAVHVDQALPELVDRDLGRVDHPIGQLPQVGQELALLADPVQERPRRHRVPASGLVVAPHERLLGGFEEEDLRAVPRARAARPAPRPPSAGTRARGCRRRARCGRCAGSNGWQSSANVGDQRGGQVVHAVVPHVLEALDRPALSGAGQTRDDDEADAVRLLWLGVGGSSRRARQAPPFLPGVAAAR